MEGGDDDGKITIIQLTVIYAAKCSLIKIAVDRKGRPYLRVERESERERERERGGGHLERETLRERQKQYA